MALALGQRALFEIPDDVTYLNCAYLAPQLHSVRIAGQEALARRAAPWHMTPREFFSDVEHARSRFARLIGTSADCIALIPSVSYGMMVATACCPLARGQNVVVLAEEFPSIPYAWRDRAQQVGANVRTVSRAVAPTAPGSPTPAAPGSPTHGAMAGATRSWTDAVLDAIDADTAVVAVSHCFWTDGSLLDLEAIGQRARAVGARLVLDTTQSMGAYPFDVATVQPDVVAFAAYKWGLCPYGVSFLYVAPQHHDTHPTEQGWIARAGSEDFSRLVDYRDDYQPGARRFDVGQRSNFILLPMAIAALDQLLAWGVDAIHQALRTLTDQLADGALALGLEVLPPEQRAGHMLGLQFPQGLPAGLVQTLTEQQIYVSVRGSSLRVSPHLHSAPEDIDRLLGLLRSAI